LPRDVAPRFPDDGSHLQRYAAVFDAAEINSSFYRAHRRETYAKWAATVPRDFRFSVKLPREITHDLRLRACARPLLKFLGEIDGLGARLGCVLIQLPPSFTFERAPVKRFLTLLRRHFDRNAVVEPRHATWFEPVAEETLREFAIGRVGSDPALCAEAAIPMPNARVAYRRLHGSPRIHQLFHQPLLVLDSKVGIAHPPEPIANDEIAPIRRDWMLQARHQMKGFPPVTATVVPEV